MKFITVGNGEILPAVGQGGMGLGGEFSRNYSNFKQCCYALEHGIDKGLTFIDTAEVYGDGLSEEIVGEVALGKRAKLFLASKFSPENSSFDRVIRAAEGSLKRLKTDVIDLYQFHWPNPTVPLQETLEAMTKLHEDGKIRYIGLSNFSNLEMQKAQKLVGKHRIFSNQVEYNLFDRYAEHNILPLCRTSGSVLVAYSPLDNGRAIDDEKRNSLLNSISAKYGRSPSQIALNWLTRGDSVIVIPKAINKHHIELNAESTDFTLEEDDSDAIDQMFNSSPKLVATSDIKVISDGIGNRRVYQTVEQAKENALGLSPSPIELAQSLKLDESIKPVRLVRAEPNSNYLFSLVEGRVKFWAWVIAFDGKKPIPAYIRDKL